jgi:hypothetical protein
MGASIMSTALSLATASYELRFDSMFVAGRGLSFPCDARGCVDLDRLSDRARHNYLYARAVVGREFLTPSVCCCALH